MKKPTCCQSHGLDHCNQGDDCPEYEEVSEETLARIMGMIFVGLLCAALLLSTAGEML